MFSYDGSIVITHIIDYKGIFSGPIIKKCFIQSYVDILPFDTF